MPLTIADLLNPMEDSPSLTRKFNVEESSFVLNEGGSQENFTTSASRRTPKACTYCRRDKARCDRERPCGGCVRKGRAQLCLDGCFYCRQDRISCDEGRPCGSCIQKGRECVDNRPLAMAPRWKKRKEQQPPSQSPPVREHHSSRGGYETSTSASTSPLSPGRSGPSRRTSDPTSGGAYVMPLNDRRRPSDANVYENSSWTARHRALSPAIPTYETTSSGRRESFSTDMLASSAMRSTLPIVETEEATSSIHPSGSYRYPPSRHPSSSL